MTTALIDADIVSYRCAASAENDPEEIAILRADKLLKDILVEVEAGKYINFFSCPRKLGFRREIYPAYKANRDGKPKPKHLDATQEFIASEWGSVINPSLEADDLLGIYQKEDTIICSIDKDLYQINGRHYNFVKKEFQEINDPSHVTFYCQMVLGDASDNIPGYDGKLRTKVPKFVEEIMTDVKALNEDSEQAMFMYVYNLYYNKEQFLKNLDLLWIMKREGEKCTDRQEVKNWILLNQSQQEMEQEPISGPETQNPYMGLITQA